MGYINDKEDSQRNQSIIENVIAQKKTYEKCCDCENDGPMDVFAPGQQFKIFKRTKSKNDIVNLQIVI